MTIVTVTWCTPSCLCGRCVAADAKYDSLSWQEEVEILPVFTEVEDL